MWMWIISAYKLLEFDYVPSLYLIGDYGLKASEKLDLASSLKEFVIN